MDNDEWIYQTDEQEKVVKAEALKAAIESLRTFDFNEYQEDQLIMRALLAALVAIKAVCERARVALCAANPGRNVHGIYFHEAHVLATALWVVSEQLDTEEIEIQPESIRGNMWLMFATVNIALSHAAQLDAIMSDGYEATGGEEAAEDLLNKLSTPVTL